MRWCASADILQADWARFVDVCLKALTEDGLKLCHLRWRADDLVKPMTPVPRSERGTHSELRLIHKCRCRRPFSWVRRSHLRAKHNPTASGAGTPKNGLSARQRQVVCSESQTNPSARAR